MAQHSLDHLGVGLRLGPAGYTLVKKARRCALVASANQDKPIFDAIPGYLAAARGFARLTSATLAPPKASQPSTPESTFPHPDASRSTRNDTVATQSRRNHRQRRVRHCRKLSLGSADLGIDMTLDATTGLWTSTDDDMRIGKVTLTLTMGHGRLPAQALAELVTPGAQFVQHMAPVPVLARQPGDPPLGNQEATPHCSPDQTQMMPPPVTGAMTARGSMTPGSCWSSARGHAAHLYPLRSKAVVAWST